MTVSSYALFILVASVGFCQHPFAWAQGKARPCLVETPETLEALTEHSVFDAARRIGNRDCGFTASEPVYKQAFDALKVKDAGFRSLFELKAYVCPKPGQDAGDKINDLLNSGDGFWANLEEKLGKQHLCRELLSLYGSNGSHVKGLLRDENK